MGEYTFRNCSGLTSATIPASVTSMGDFAFGKCKGLASIKYRGTEAQWGAIYKDVQWNSLAGKHTITYNYPGE